MAPRQRLSAQPSQEEMAASTPLLSKEGEPSVAEVEAAREAHDLFNIGALLFVIATTLSNWNVALLAQGPAQAWTGDFFYVNWATTICYFLLDLLWVASVPICVKSPDVIIKHHFVAIAYLSGPILWPEYRWFMGACLTVEINTWFLILRRVLYKRKERISPIITDVVACSFYTSWIVIRIFVYPAIMVAFCCMAYKTVVETGILWHWPMMFMPVHFFLCVLNLKWSYDLFAPMIAAQWGAADEKPVAVASGL